MVFGLTYSVRQLWRELEVKGYDKAYQVTTQLENKAGIEFVESELNDWGYKLVGQKMLTKALAIFSLNTQLFSKSANTYDSLAEVHWMLGNLEKAMFFYNKVLELQPNNAYAQDQLKKLEAEFN